MKVKTALIILISIMVLGLIGLGVAYQVKKNQSANKIAEPKIEIPAPIKELTSEEKKEAGKARAAELLRMMDRADGASSTPLTEEQKAIKIKEGEARAAALLKMMK